MSKTITQNEKAEFKRFFEYAFQTSFDLWPDFPELAEVFSKKVRGSEEERKYNIAISKVIQSKDALFGILGYGALAMDEKLRYYAYLFLKDHGITDEALIGYGIDIPRLKTVDELYDEMFNRAFYRMWQYLYKNIPVVTHQKIPKKLLNPLWQFILLVSFKCYCCHNSLW